MHMMRHGKMLRLGVLLTAVTPVLLLAADAQPWLDGKWPADERARLAVAAMTLDEKLSLLHGPMAFNVEIPDSDVQPPKIALPADAIQAAGYIPGVARLGIPALKETDASLGVTNPLGVRPGDTATALPAGLALAASFNPELAYRAGALVGSEAHAKGFNVLLSGGMNLTRDPRNGRNFEYLGEDPLLAGVMAGESVRGTQDQHVISTLKHFALNANETNRNNLDARIDKAALRESDLLAFQLAIERGQPGSIMCAYNKVNGAYACGNHWLLDDVLKHDWAYPGWVMSDWGAVWATDYALQGLDQESGEQLDRQVWFGELLKTAVQAGQVPVARIDDMARRILRSMFAVGVVDHPPATAQIDYQAHAATALAIARQGIVLLKNDNALLPLKPNLKRIAVIGGNAHVGVLSGGGSSQVTPTNGRATVLPIGGRGLMGVFRTASYFPSSPVKALRAANPDSEIVYDAGAFPADAAALAATADVAVVFATRHELEGYDIPDLTLPNGQNELIEAVAAANPHTIVVLETGNPVVMPWLNKVQAVLAAWYPGQEGGQAVADILSGQVNPSGRLPITFPMSEQATMRPRLPNLGVEPGTDVSIDYSEGADVGYRWYAKQGVQPLFAFGHGLSYSTFEYAALKVSGGKTLTVRFEVHNSSSRDGVDVPQIYLRSVAGQPEFKLIGFERVALKAGERRQVTLTVEPRLLAHFDEAHRKWIARKGAYQISLGHSANDFVLKAQAILDPLRF
jgi:beta-glucosidase